VNKYLIQQINIVMGIDTASLHDIENGLITCQPNLRNQYIKIHVLLEQLLSHYVL